MLFSVVANTMPSVLKRTLEQGSTMILLSAAVSDE
jgi:hypothetical protein